MSDIEKTAIINNTKIGEGTKVWNSVLRGSAAPPGYPGKPYPLSKVIKCQT